ncbi:MAG: hypothetical protein ACRD2U_11625 [Terriglobales bacterium]
MSYKDTPSILEKTPLYHPLRDVYLYAFRHKYWEENVKFLRTIYKPFVKSGSLVFDIGANVGEHTRSFIGLGARVIAVEPHPGCIPRLRRIYPKKRVMIEDCVAGAKIGCANLHFGDEDCLSSVSDEWIGVAQHSDRF